MEGPQTLMVSLQDENGAPHSGQPVVLSWPSLAEPSQDMPVIPTGSKSCYTSRGVIQRTENGCTGFGLGGGSYISNPAVGGPYSVFVLSPSTYSDCLTGTGWLGGTNHMGPCRLTFRIVAAGVAPEPEPEPEPGADDELVGLVARFTVATERIARPWNGWLDTWGRRVARQGFSVNGLAGWLTAGAGRLARVDAVAVGQAGDGLTRVARGGGPLDRSWAELSGQFSDALETWRKNPLARRIIGLTSSYVVGDGITLTSAYGPLKRYLAQWWSDPKNLMDLRLTALSDELARAGELFIVLHFNRADGMSYVRTVPASLIDGIKWAPGDYEEETSYHEMVGLDDPDYAKGGRTWYAPAASDSGASRRTKRTPTDSATSR